MLVLRGCVITEYVCGIVRVSSYVKGTTEGVSSVGICVGIKEGMYVIPLNSSRHAVVTSVNSDIAVVVVAAAPPLPTVVATVVTVAAVVPVAAVKMLLEEGTDPAMVIPLPLALAVPVPVPLAVVVPVLVVVVLDG